MSGNSMSGKETGNPTRLGHLLNGERAKLILVTVLGTISVGLVVAGPQLLGNATNILFNGVVSKQLPAHETKAQVIAGLRTHGQGHLANVLSAMDLHPGFGVNFTHLGQVLGLAALAYIFSTVFSWNQGFVMSGVAVRVVYRLRQAVAAKLNRLPLQFFDSHPHGDILSRVSNDIDNIFTTLQEGVGQLLISVLSVFGMLGMMFWISPLLAAISLVTIPVAIVVTGLIARRSKARFTAQWEQTGQLNGLVEETHTGHSLVQAFGQRERMISEFDSQNERLYQASFRAQFLSGVILPAIQFTNNLNYVVIAAVGGYQVATGVITLGAVTAFIQYSRRFAMPIAQIAGQMSVLQSGLASAARVFEFLNAPEEAVIAEAELAIETGLAAEAGLAAETGLAAEAGLAASNGHVAGSRVQLKNVCFRYDPERPLIDDFTLEAEPGQTVAIVGPTGAGKTTIVNLLMRFYEVDSGQILLDGTDYRDLGRDEVRRCFGMVLQDTWLFGGTIRDNIGYGKEGATDEEIIAAARAAYVDDFVRTLPDGYDTVLDGDAASISAGQKQLLTIARAFLADPGILILDEATSNVDTRTEIFIQDAMARLRLGRTSFVIAHRLSTIRNAGTIVVMDEGRVIEQGRHDELLSQRGLYHDLYNSQFSAAVVS
ncbi:MAG TPA: ABC transporter ATP-binding protein [Streptosporangiaceae bacterium]